MTRRRPREPYNLAPPRTSASLLHVVTAIAPAPRRPNLCSVRVADEPFVITPEAAVRLGLRPGRELDERDLTALRHEGEVQRVVDRALRMLAFRSRASAELKRGLEQKGERGPHVDAAIARLVAAGALDDEAFAQHFARGRLLRPRRDRARDAHPRTLRRPPPRTLER